MYGMQLFLPGLHSHYEVIFSMSEEKTEKKPIDISMPEIYQGMKTAKITFWIFEEDEVDTIDPGDKLLRVETERAFFDISVPPWIITKCRVKTLHKKAGEVVTPGELLISIEPLAE
jgi:pyruvate/2-oxoglutarate dehydrogenase complex dihydrolipoamide acyltransferase (E2) component